MSTVATSVGKFVWREQVSDDPAKAQSFYTQLFGWGAETFKPGEVDYTMIAANDKMHGGFSKGLEGSPPPHWLSHVHVDNVDETIEKAKNAGGKVAFGPQDMPSVGRMAIIGDPQGGYVGLYQPEDQGPDGEGVFVWEELATTDADGSQKFYEAVFGWTTSEMGGEYGGYRIFNQGERGVAGVMQTDQIPHARWQPYVAVDDVDATVAKARELGASTLFDPMDVPKVGRLTVIKDPQGATFGVIAPDPESAA